MRKFLKTSLLAAALAGMAVTAQADTVTGTLNVNLTITTACNLTATPISDVNFTPTSQTYSGNIDARGQITVTCVGTVPYDIQLNGGVRGDRTMISGTDLIPYELYQDAGRSQVWGQTMGVGGNTVTGDHTDTYDVYGRVVSSGTFPAGVYTDAVTVTVNY